MYSRYARPVSGQLRQAMARFLPYGRAYIIVTKKAEWGMTYPRRRLFISMIVVALIITAVPTLWIGAKWKRALTNVDKMLVTPVVLPTATAAPQAAHPTPAANADEAPAPI